MRIKRPKTKIELRKVTEASYEEGCWVKHDPTNTWFEAWDLTSGMLVGFNIYNEDVVFPIRECVHAFDRDLDAA